MIIRRAVEKDLYEVNAIEQGSFPIEEAGSLDKFEYRLTNFPKWFIVAEIEGKVVGAVVGRPMSQRFITDEYYENETVPEGDALAIISVATDGEFRRQGVADAMMKYILAEASKSEFATSSLCCKEGLIDYYSRFGYKLIGLSKSEHGGAKWYDMEMVF
ncbi:MAG: GNAT family N-acetyltransferase [Peptostreptococcaceae bacterium]|nr:GNAT family N-acetyltransferase [Peptostreptococcaceae bacterium]